MIKETLMILVTLGFFAILLIALIRIVRASYWRIMIVKMKAQLEEKKSKRKIDWKALIFGSPPKEFAELKRELDTKKNES